MDGRGALVADQQLVKAAEPSQRAFNHPAMSTEPLARVDTAPGDARSDVTGAQRAAAAPMIVGFVGVQFCGTTLRTASAAVSDRRDRVDQGLEDAAVVAVGAREFERKRDALGVGEKMAFGARTRTVGGIGAGKLAPFLAGTEAESMHARDQSSRSACASRSSSRRCSACHTPASCHSLSRRQHVIPEPQPISRGRYSQGMPLLSTKRIPVSAARSDTRGRPPSGLFGCCGSSGSIVAHNVSVSKGAAMQAQRAHRLAVPVLL